MGYFLRALIAVLFVVASNGQSQALSWFGTSIKVDGAWARATVVGSSQGKIYLTLINSGSRPERLVGGTTPVAQEIVLHSNSLENGVIRMRELTSVYIAPKAKVVLKPGGAHAMMIGLKRPLMQGKSFPLTLEFENAGKIDVVVFVEKIGAMERRGLNSRITTGKDAPSLPK